MYITISKKAHICHQGEFPLVLILFLRGVISLLPPWTLMGTSHPRMGYETGSWGWLLWHAASQQCCCQNDVIMIINDISWFGPHHEWCEPMNRSLIKQRMIKSTRHPWPEWRPADALRMTYLALGIDPWTRYLWYGSTVRDHGIY